MANLDEVRFPISFSGATAGQNLNTARSWYQKGYLFSPKDKAKPAAFPGAMTLVSGRSILAHAIAAKLAAMGLHPELACQAARRFTDISNKHEAPGFDRDPGELFAGSQTVLAAYDDGSAKIIRCAGVQRKAGIIEPPILDAFRNDGFSWEGAYLVLLDNIVKHVHRELEDYDSRRSEGRPG